MGMNIVPVYGNEQDVTSYKRNGLDIERWHNEGQGIEDVMSFDWTRATGVGLITGFNGYRALDIDNIDCSDLEYDESTVIRYILLSLNLPVNYSWIVKSGSGKGYHIIFRTDALLDMSKSNYTFTPNRRIIDDVPVDLRVSFEKIELSWNFFLILPPSIHHTKGQYVFIEDQLPKEKPSKISNKDLANFLMSWCGIKMDYFLNINKGDLLGIEFRYRIIKLRNSYATNDLNNVSDIDEIKGLLMSCEEGRNLFALDQIEKFGLSKEIIEFFKTCDCESARYNIANLMSYGLVEERYYKTHTLLTQLLNEGTIEDWEFESLNEAAKKNCKPTNKILFFDTETNGVIPKYSNNYNDYPRIVQICWIVADEEGNIEKTDCYIIKPVDFDIPESASKIHGITKQKALESGSEIENVIQKFLTDLSGCNAIVGHNVSFDLNVLKGELIRLQIDTNALDKMPSYCTMKLTVDYCQIRSNNPYHKYKYPKLVELYEKLFGEKFDNIHNAEADVAATMKCFFELISRHCIYYEWRKETYKEIAEKCEKSKRKEEELLWARINENSSSALVSQYISKYNNGLYIEEAKEMLDNLEWKKCIGSIDKCEQYIKKYPKGRFVTSAKREIERITKYNQEIRDITLKLENERIKERQLGCALRACFWILLPLTIFIIAIIVNIKNFIDHGHLLFVLICFGLWILCLACFIFLHRKFNK